MPVRKTATNKKATAKKAAAKKRSRPQPPPTMRLHIDPAIVEQIVLLMIGGLSDALLYAAAIEKLKLSPELATAAIDEAKRLITLAADYNRHEELGRAVRRINSLYGSSLKMQDTKTALACQKELNKLLSLYEPPGQQKATTESTENPEAVAIRSHLVPLQLAADSTPLTEVCRLAALKIIATLAGRTS